MSHLTTKGWIAMLAGNEEIGHLVNQIAELFPLHVRFIDPNGATLAQSKNRAPICHLINSCEEGRKLCNSCLWPQGEGYSTQEAEIRYCAGELAHIAVPVHAGGQLLGWLLCGAHRVRDGQVQPEAKTRLQQLATRLSLPVSDLLEAYDRSPAMTDEAITLTRGMVQQLAAKNLGEVLHSNYVGLAVELFKAATLANLWPNVCAILQIMVPGESVEVFGVTSAQEVVVLVWPELGLSEECRRIQDWIKEGRSDPIQRESGEVLAPVRTENRLLAVIRIHSRQRIPHENSELESLRMLADAAAETLLALRERRTEEVLGRLNSRLTEVKKYKQRLALILEESIRLLGCDDGDISLLNVDAPGWLKVVARHGEGTERLPYQIPSDAGVTGRVLRTGETAVVPRLESDPDYQIAMTTKLKTRYREEQWQEYHAFLRKLKGCVKVPLKVGNEILGILCLHRRVEGPFDLDLVAVVEALAERAAVEAACVLVSENYSLRPQKSAAPPPDWATRFANTQPADARHQLIKELAEKAWAMSGAYRVAVCMLNPDKTELSVEETAGEWSTDFKKWCLSLLTDDGATTYAINTQQHYFLEDTQQLGAHHLPVPPDRTRSAAAVLLRSGTHLIGVVSLSWDAVGVCDDSPDGLKLREQLIRLADEYATPIKMFDVDQHLRLLEQTFKQLKQTEDSSLDYRGFLATVQRMVGASQGMVFIRNRDSGRYDLQAHSAQPERVGDARNSYERGEGFTGWVAEKNRPLRLVNRHYTEADLAEIDKDLKPKNKVPDTTSSNQQWPAYLAVPIAVGDEVLGVLRLTGSLRQCFSVDDEQIAVAACSRLAGYLFENQEGKRTQVLIDLYSGILQMSSLKELREQVFVALRAGLGECDGNIRILDKVQEGAGPLTEVLLRLAASREDWVTGPLIRRKGEGIAGRLFETGEEEFVDEDITRSASPCQGMHGILPEKFFVDVRSLVCVTIRVGSRLAGTLYVHKCHPRSFSAVDLAFCKKIARVAGLGLETVDKQERDHLELQIERAADEFLLGFLRGGESRTLESTLLHEVLGALVQCLGGSSGWVRTLNEAESQFEVLASIGHDKAYVPDVPVEQLLQVLGPDGLRVVFDLERDQEAEPILSLWSDSRTREFASHQRCLISLRAGGNSLAVFTLLARPFEAVSYKRAEKARDLLLLLGEKIEIGRRFEQQHRDVQIGTPLALLGSMIGGLEHRIVGPMRKLKAMIDFLKSAPRTPEQIRVRHAVMDEEWNKLEAHMQELNTLPSLSREAFFLGNRSPAIWPKNVAGLQRWPW